MRILHLDDDLLQLDIARSWLEAEGHSLTSVSTDEQAILEMQANEFDIAVLDWIMPDMSGEEVLRWIRSHGGEIPVVFATSNEQEWEVAHILELGADDYLVKPLRRVEFLARLNAVVRRARGAQGAIPASELSPYRIDRATRIVLLQGEPVRMSRRMADLAMLMFDSPGEIISRKKIFQKVWGVHKALESRTVDTFMSRLRTALELDGRHGWRLAAVYQHGYRLHRID